MLEMRNNRREDRGSTFFLNKLFGHFGFNYLLFIVIDGNRKLSLLRSKFINCKEKKLRVVVCTTDNLV